LTVPVDLDEAQLRELALNNERVQQFINSKPIQNVIVVPRRLVNIVVGA